MNISHTNTSTLTHTALTALKNAYEKCSDQAAKELILSATNAITLLQYDFGLKISAKTEPWRKKNNLLRNYGTRTCM